MQMKNMFLGLMAMLTLALIMTGCESDEGGNGVSCGPYRVSVNQAEQYIEISNLGRLSYSSWPVHPPFADARIGDTNMSLTNMVWNGDQLISFDITIDGTHSCHWPAA